MPALCLKIRMNPPLPNCFAAYAPSLSPPPLCLRLKEVDLILHIIIIEHRFPVLFAAFRYYCPRHALCCCAPPPAPRRFVCLPLFLLRFRPDAPADARGSVRPFACHARPLPRMSCATPYTPTRREQFARPPAFAIHMPPPRPSMPMSPALPRRFRYATCFC